MFAADAELEARPGPAPAFDAHRDERADADGVDRGERVAVEDLLVGIDLEKLADIVSREAEGELGQVVGAEGEELRLGGNLVGGDRAARDLDHGADQVRDLDALFFHDLGGDAVDDRLLVLELLDEPDQRDHDLGNDLRSFLVQAARGLDDRARLHLGDFRVGDPEADTAMAEHRVELVQLLDAGEQLFLVVELLAARAGGLEPGDVDHQVLALGQELVQRRVDRPDRHRFAAHALEDAVEVVALQRQQFVQRLAAVGLVVGQDHLLDDRDAPLAEEHVLGAAQADAARAERVGELRLILEIGVGADAKGAVVVGPRQQLLEALVDARLLRVERLVDHLEDLARLRGDASELHFPAEAVERDEVALLHRVAADAACLPGFVDHQLARADD